MIERYRAKFPQSNSADGSERFISAVEFTAQSPVESVALEYADGRRVPAHTVESLGVDEIATAREVLFRRFDWFYAQTPGVFFKSDGHSWYPVDPVTGERL